MIASRSWSPATDVTLESACPPRRSFVASDARRRGQAYGANRPKTIAFGDKLPTPALRASVDNLWSFTLMPDT